MATVLSDIIYECQRLFDPVPRSITVSLNGSITAGATSLSFTDSSAGSANSNSILVGSILSCDLELFFVQAVSGTTVTVVPGYRGSTQANHASGTLIYVRTRFTDFEIFRQINNVLDELGSNGLFNLNTCEIAYNAVQQAYDLTDAKTSTAVTNLIEGVSLRYLTPLPDRKHRTIPSMKWEIEPAVGDDANFPSGYALILNDDAWPGFNMLLAYKQGFSHFTNTNTPATDYAQNVQTTTLLPATCNDILAMGVMIRMIAPREVQRNQTNAQPDSRLAPEVPPGAVAASVNAVRAEYMQRIADEKTRQKRLIGQYRRRY